MISLVNKELPINLNYNEDIINRIYDKYPLVNKKTIILVVNFTFIALRNFLIIGKVINFFNLFLNLKLYFFLNNWRKQSVVKIKAKIKTPKALRHDK